MPPIRPDYTPQRDPVLGVYCRSEELSANSPGDGILISGVTSEGAIVLTLQLGGTVQVDVPLGTCIFPFACIAAAPAPSGGAAGASFKSLFLS